MRAKCSGSKFPLQKLYLLPLIIPNKEVYRHNIKIAMKKLNFPIIIGFICCYVTAGAQNYVKTALGIKTQVNNIDIEIQFFAPKIVRIIKSPPGINDDKHSLSVIQ